MENWGKKKLADKWEPVDNTVVKRNPKTHIYKISDALGQCKFEGRKGVSSWNGGQEMEMTEEGPLMRMNWGVQEVEQGFWATGTWGSLIAGGWDHWAAETRASH